MSPDQDTWIDGSVTDENPLVLPYIKWCRERERHPDTTPPTLKIVLVNLNLRSTESGVVRKFQALSLLNNPFVVRQCEHLAARAKAEAGDDVGAQVVAAFALATSRAPTADESKTLADYAARHGLANACR